MNFFLKKSVDRNYNTRVVQFDKKKKMMLNLFLFTFYFYCHFVFLFLVLNEITIVAMIFSISELLIAPSRTLGVMVTLQV